jgi:hypothetical protein
MVSCIKQLYMEVQIRLPILIIYNWNLYNDFFLSFFYCDNFFDGIKSFTFSG